VKLLLRSLVFIGLLSPLGLSATTWFVTPTGSGTSCTQAAPCSLATAAGLTNPGDIVQLGPGGTYARLNIPRSGSAAGGYITYRGHDGSGCPITPISDPLSRGVRPNPSAITLGFRIDNVKFVRIECLKIIGDSITGDAAVKGGGGDHIDIIDNVMDGTATPGSPETGIDSTSNNLYVARNFITRTGNGINVISNNSVFEDNESFALHAGPQSEMDHAHPWGDTQLWQRNYFHGNTLADCPGCHSDCYQVFVLTTPSQFISRNITITQNVCMNVDETIITSNSTSDSTLMGPWTVTNNILGFARIGNSQGGGGFQGMNVLFAHNTVVNAILGCGRSPDTLTYTVTWKNNIFFNATTGNVQGGCQSTQTNNMNWFTFSPNFIDPKFVDLANNNFHLQASSPAINKGATGLGINVDKDNNPRDSQPDIGAFEFGAANFPQTLTNVQVTVR
jgi:hypothetical protein